MTSPADLPTPPPRREPARTILGVFALVVGGMNVLLAALLLAASGDLMAVLGGVLFGLGLLAAGIFALRLGRAGDSQTFMALAFACLARAIWLLTGWGATAAASGAGMGFLVLAALSVWMSRRAPAMAVAGPSPTPPSA